MPYYYKGFGFSYDNNGYVKVYTDGACSANGTDNARAGIGVFFGNNHPLNVSQPASGRQTNNVAEIQAVTVAAYQARKAGIKKLRIYTDSEFLYNSATMWIEKWRNNGWITARGTSVANRSDFEEMEDALDCIDNIHWTHVNSHSGTYGNEMADKLAREGIDEFNNLYSSDDSTSDEAEDLSNSDYTSSSSDY
ncbi:ribonuclease H1-like [Belonocnema kinseyi]|uniref:ribonuclease H1-like n=1 Tax=Belonocnema kinseyi TaxID=2817044 RepID=UPI00143E04A5|nr:ribonuclease H1-like [Belonocnema kinseyi]XP_033219720.1 ribonuclease H1-like [Belonocnema kinseyi]